MKTLIMFIFAFSLILQSILYSQKPIKDIVPFSLKYSNQITEKDFVRSVNLPCLDFDSLISKVETRNKERNLPFQFGHPFEVNYTPENSGTWDTIENVGRIWRLRIVSKGAKSLNFTYFIFKTTLTNTEREQQ